MKTKVCGLKYAENIQQVVALRPDFVGFIFYKGSKRYVGEDFEAAQLWDLPSAVKKTGVFVNEKILNVLEIVARYNLDLVQLHGEESPETCAELKKYVPVIKAFQVDELFDGSLLSAYENAVDYFLFDTKSTDRGGSGKKFNWNILKNLLVKKPFFLSGGIEPADLNEALTISPFAIDVNSRFEEEPGLKNIEKLTDLLKQLRNHELQR